MDEYLQRNNGYLARQEIDQIKNHWYQEDPLRLEPYGNKVFSQADEDGIIEEIFFRLGIYNGVFVEIGTENGLECNTHYLLHKNWVGHWFEGDITLSEPIQSNFKQFMDKDKLRVALGRLTKENINEAFLRAAVPTKVDFLSIDIDGMDIHLFQTLDIDAKVVCIEYNAKWPSNIIRIPEYDPNYNWDGSSYMGSSLKALCEVADKKGYELVGTNVTGSNAFFVRKDLISDRFVANRTPEYLYNPPRYWLIYDHYWFTSHPTRKVGKYQE